MAKTELQNIWLALRSTGLSYSKIAKRIGVSVNTQLKWEAKLKDKLDSIKSENHQFINQQLRLNKSQRLERLSNQLDRLEAELDKRDISDISTPILLRIFTAIAKDIRTEIDDKSRNDKKIDESLNTYNKIIQQITNSKDQKN